MTSSATFHAHIFEILAGLDEAVWKSCPEGFGHMSPVRLTTSNSSIFAIRKVTQYLAHDLCFVLHFLIPVQPSEGPSQMCFRVSSIRCAPLTSQKHLAVSARTCPWGRL